jgi:hypothetical protein
LTAQQEIFEAVAGTRWKPREAIFARLSKHVMADIEIGSRGCLARVWVNDVALVASMERAGYAVSDQSGERSLHIDELIEERAMLERAVARPASIRSWPARRSRSICAFSKRRVDAAFVRSMAKTTWTWTVTEVARRGAHGYAWCVVIDDDGPSIEVGLRMHWRKKPPGPVMRDARKKLAAALGPHGYVSANVRGEIVLEKSVRSVGEARVERERLDRFLG